MTGDDAITGSIQQKDEKRRARFDYNKIVSIIREGSKVLDLGCGNGTLLHMLVKEKRVEARGIELKQERIRSCIKKGLSVLHGDLDEGLKYYKDKSFDYVIFNQTIQVVKNSLLVLLEALRVGEKVIVSFPNFGHWRIRASYLIRGRMPKSPALPYEWYNTPNIHLLTIKDFIRLCEENDIAVIDRTHYSLRKGNGREIWLCPNLHATHSIFIVSKKSSA